MVLVDSILCENMLKHHLFAHNVDIPKKDKQYVSQ